MLQAGRHTGQKNKASIYYSMTKKYIQENLTWSSQRYLQNHNHASLISLSLLCKLSVLCTTEDNSLYLYAMWETFLRRQKHQVLLAKLSSMRIILYMCIKYYNYPSVDFKQFWNGLVIVKTTPTVWVMRQESVENVVRPAGPMWGFENQTEI